MSDQKPEYKLSLEDTRLSKRWVSWFLFVVILALFLIVPMASLVSDDAADALRGSPLPSDNSWSLAIAIPRTEIQQWNAI